MAAKPIPPQSELLQLLRYEPDTGKLFWRERTVDMFPAKTPRRSQCLCALWNSRYAGQEAFTCISDGYKTGSIFGQNYKAHRVIWKMVHNEEPPEIDHEFGVRSDNRLAMLKGVTQAENAKNRRLPANNTTGVVGVHKWNHNGTNEYWVATVGPHKQGYFHSFDEAVAARQTAERENGFHPNHGRAA